jgi:chemotaxis regulatin CheY-phosphate phosphatase CheZ
MSSDGFVSIGERTADLIDERDAALKRNRELENEVAKLTTRWQNWMKLAQKMHRMIDDDTARGRLG